MLGSRFAQWTRLHQRRSIRLADHAYAGGIYSVTIGAAGNRALFGDVIRGRMRPSATGAMVQDEWLRTADLRSGIWLDAYVVMPTHVHTIIGLDPSGYTDGDPGPDRPSLASIIGGFKAACTGRYRELIADPDARLWHRGYYEHLIRGPDQLARARRYIELNPRRWKQ